MAHGARRAGARTAGQHRQARQIYNTIRSGRAVRGLGVGDWEWDLGFEVWTLANELAERASG